MSQTRRSQRFVHLASVLALLAGASPAFPVPVAEISSPRPNGWSVDLTGTIPAETLRQIDHFGDEIRAENGAEIAVVVIDSTDGVPSHDFARSLFDQWRIGESDEDNGFLILAAMADRKVEIVLGKGLDTPANNQASAEILQGDIVPLLRAGDPGGALLAGTRAAARRILGVEPPVAETATPALPLAETAPPMQSPAERAIASPPLAETPHRSAPDRSGPLFLFLGLGGLALIGIGYFLLRAPRCKTCRMAMSLLEEHEDDAYLTPAERTEDRIGSVQHEIWLCSQCGQTKKKSWSNLFAGSSGYSHCPSCRAKALRTTLWINTPPSYESDGERCVDTSCAHCGHQTHSTVPIPRLVQTRNDDDSNRWSSSSSEASSLASVAAVSTFSDSGSSGSSDSGSSGYSGGESSGGGASGSW